MGVHGLWRLIESSGKPVPLETLENKVLAVDVSIWLHQIVKGFQDTKGAPLANAHLLGLYHRICKLLYFRIKPVFVFDGGVPVLKKETIVKRNQQKQKNLSEAERIHKNLLSTLLKHSAISKVLSEKALASITSTSPTKKTKKQDDDLYMLPASQSFDSTLSSSEDENSNEASKSARYYDLHSIDTKSAQFKSLPVDVRHEILTDLKETRKQSSWGCIHELPTESDDFSTYQMRRLLKRQSVQTALEDVEKEMGGHTLSLGELEKILEDQGVITGGNIKGSRIASDENTRFLLIKDIKQAVENAKKQHNLSSIDEETGEENLNNVKVESKVATNGENSEENVEKTVKNKGDTEFEDDLKRAIALSLEEEPSTSKTAEDKLPEKVKIIGGKGKNRLPLSFLENFDDADFYDSESSEEDLTPIRLTPAQRYMMEYSGLTAHEITKIIASKSGASKKVSKEKEKAVIDNVTTVEEKLVKSYKNHQEKIIIKEVIHLTKGGDIIKEMESLNAKEGKLETPNLEQNVLDTNESINDKTNQTELKEKVTPVSEDNNFKNNKLTETEDVEVEIISESESSNSDDFLDVDEQEEKQKTSMEVIIKPNEELVDDLFKDVFSINDNLVANKNSRSVNLDENESVEKRKEHLEDSGIEEENEKKLAEFEVQQKKHSTLTVKDKIEKMIQNYSKPKTGATLDNPELSLEQMKEIKDNLNKEQEQLIVERSTKERLGSNITDQMYQEAQELLELFGVPYVIAPMEAEAQCAFLELINLTDGTITDDSDIWLFGGRTVYKNFFNKSKTVLEFKSENIQHHFKLSREQMILMAILLGSDYTVGLSGVGPVTALEILAAFPSKNELLSGLVDFKTWFHNGKLPGPGRTGLRSKLKNVTFTENFPSPRIVQAYLEPQVETSKDEFSWGKPDIIGLVDFAKQKFGWAKQKTEEILNPVLRRLEDHKKQKAITDYFKMKFKVDSGETEAKMSKRVKTAVNKIGKGGLRDEGDEEEAKPKKKKNVNPIKRRVKDNVSNETKQKKKKVTKECEEKDEDIEILKQTQESSEKRLEEIQKELQKKLEQENTKKVKLTNLHEKEVIPQKQKDKTEMLKNKLKAIETFRKSKQGPGYVKKRGKIVKTSKEDASYLSESSESN